MTAADAIKQEPKRVLSFAVAPEDIRRMDAIAKRDFRSRSSLAQQAIRELLNRLEQEGPAA